MMSGRFLLRISLLALLGFHHCEAAPPKGENKNDTTAAVQAGDTTGVKEEEGGIPGEKFSTTDARTGALDKVADVVDGKAVPPMNNADANTGEAKQKAEGPDKDAMKKAHIKCENLGKQGTSGRKLTEVWREMVECANGLVKMGQGLQTQLNDAHVAGMDYLKSYTGAYSTLTYLKGDDMLNALEKSHNNAIQAMDKEVDGVDEILNDIQPYTKYGHQKDDAQPARVVNYENDGAAKARKNAIEEANQMAKEAEAARLKAEEHAEAARLKAEAARLQAEADEKAAKANAAKMKDAELKSREQMAAKVADVAQLAAEKANQKLDEAKRAELAEARPDVSRLGETASPQHEAESGSSRDSPVERLEELSAITASTQSDEESPRASNNGAAAEAEKIKHRAKSAVLAVEAAQRAEERAEEKEEQLANVVDKDAKKFGLT